MDKVSYSDDEVLEIKKKAPPSPADFDKFLPWACSQLEVEVSIIITRKAIVEYVSTTGRKPKAKPKPKPQQTLSYSSSDFFSDNQSRFSTNKEHDTIIFIETIYDSSQELIKIKFLKNKKIPRMVIKIISLILPFHQSLNSITINSGLQKEAMYEISKILPISRITELCLDGTFLIEANYYILLAENHLKQLSIARCKINDVVVKTIAAKLVYPCPASKTLSVLNMSTNRITDLGAQYLADVLRTNRHLCYLNLADNMITDKGAINILSILGTFPLTESEILGRRERFMIYLKERNILISKTLKELRAGEFERKASRRKSVKATTTMPLVKKNKSASSMSLPNMDAMIEERAKFIVDTLLGLYADPFCPEQTETKDNEVYCFGNNHLCYLNLAYNNLTYASIKKVNEVLWMQRRRARKPKGLINIIIDGNFLPETCEELEEINYLLESELSMTRKMSIFTKKKPPHSASS